MLWTTLLASQGMVDINEATHYVVDTMVKYMFLTGAVLYVIFAFLVIRQISVMSNTVQTTGSFTIKIIGYLHFILAIMVLVYFIGVL